MTKLLPAILVSGVLAAGCAAAHKPVTLCAHLEGAGPSSDALDPEHRGVGVLTLEATAIRYEIRVPGLEHVIASHIHHGEAGTNGPMLWEINPGYVGDSTRGVASDAPPGIIRLIETFPSEFYLKLHTVRYPGGAIRGQLGPCRSP